MKFITTRFNTILLFSILIIFSSCDGQNASRVDSSTLINQISTLAIGDTVSEMHKSIFIIFQDKNANFWYGSNGQGVYRYDGKNIIHFTTKDGLCNNQIRAIQEDKSGVIYINTVDGISKFDGQAFTTLNKTETNSSNNEWKLQPDDLWFAGSQEKNGLYRFDGKLLYHLEFPKHHLENEFYSKYPNASYSPYGVYSIYRDSKGNIWFGTSVLGVCRYDGKSIAWISEPELTELDDGPAPGIRSIIEDRDGNFWFSNIFYRYKIFQNGSLDQEKGLINYKKLKGIDHSKGQKEGDFTFFMSITDDKNGDLWMATYDAGVWRYDGEDIIHYPVKDGNTNITLFSIYKDNQDVLWLGTHNGGVYNFNGKTFEKFRL